jgi:DNA-binding CsgD family transcriptional regulator
MSEINKGGRPKIVLTDEQKREVETLAAVLTTEQIADYFSISRRVFFDILERDEEVSALYKKGKARAVGFVAQNLIQKARTGDLGAQIFYLKTRAGWKETQRIEGAGDTGEHVIAYKWLDDDNEDD